VRIIMVGEGSWLCSWFNGRGASGLVLEFRWGWDGR
jgi:hypothetical protein